MELTAKDTKVIYAVVNDEPGILAKMAKVLKDGDFNILGIAGVGIAETGVIGLYIEDNQDAVFKVLGKDFPEATLRDGLVVAAKEDRPGVLREITRLLSAVNINITFATGSMHGLVLLTNDNKKAKEVLTN